MVVVFPAFFVFVILNLKEKLTLKKFLISFAFFLTGVFIYYYLIIRARSGIYLNLGDPVDLKQLLWVVTRAEYTPLEKARDFSVIIKQILRILNNIIFEFTIFGFLLAILGSYYLIKNNKKIHFIFLMILILCVLLSLSLYLNLKDEMLWILDVFLIPDYVDMAILMYVGILYFFKYKLLKYIFILLALAFIIYPSTVVCGNITKRICFYPNGAYNRFINPISCPIWDIINHNGRSPIIPFFNQKPLTGIT
jgi:hypothetical protein